MKKFYSLAVILIALAVFAGYQTVNIGTNPNDGTGDTVRNAFTKVNANFAQVTADFVSATNLPGYGKWLTNSQAGTVSAGAFYATNLSLFAGGVAGAGTFQWSFNPSIPSMEIGVGGLSIYTNAFIGTNDYITDFGSRISGLRITNSTATATNFALIAPQWVDIPVNYAFSVTGPSAPSLVVVTNNSAIQGVAFDNTDVLYAQAQFPHTIAITNAIFPVFYTEPHIHYSLTGVTIDSAHSNVTWQIEWDLASIGGYYSSRGTNTVTQGVTATGFHYMAEFGHLTNAVPPGISAIFRCRITRPASGSQDIGNGHIVLIDALDIHVPVGNATAIGSRADNQQL
jgi:hypothetical protein